MYLLCATRTLAPLGALSAQALTQARDNQEGATVPHTEREKERERERERERKKKRRKETKTRETDRERRLLLPISNTV